MSTIRTDNIQSTDNSVNIPVEALRQMQVQGAASWSPDGAPYLINAQVYHNGKQWLALRPNSVEPAEGDDWAEFGAAASTPPQVVTGVVDSVTGNSFTASAQIMAFGSVGAGSLLVGLQYREDGDSNWTETTPAAVSAIGTYPVTVSNLDPNKTYQFQAFGRDALNPATFVVGEVRTVLTDNVYVEAPSVSVEGSPDVVGETPTITVSPFSVFGGSDTYVRSEVKVFQNDTEIFSEPDVDLEGDWEWVLPASILVEDASGYRVDVRHVGFTFGLGSWGQSSVFSTKEEFFEFTPSFAGQPFGGGFYAGANIIVNGQEYALVVAPRSQGGLSATALQWRTSSAITPGTNSLNDGLANSNAMNNSSHPAAQFCRGLNINGHTDWYLPSQDELEICYRYLKPTTTPNSLPPGGRWGTNSNSKPVGAIYTASNPAQTSNSIFQQGGGEDFRLDSTNLYWSSTTRANTTAAKYQDFDNSVQGLVENNMNHSYEVRAVRRVPV